MNRDRSVSSIPDAAVRHGQDRRWRMERRRPPTGLHGPGPAAAAAAGIRSAARFRCKGRLSALAVAHLDHLDLLAYLHHIDRRLIVVDACNLLARCFTA